MDFSENIENSPLSPIFSAIAEKNNATFWKPALGAQAPSCHPFGRISVNSKVAIDKILLFCYLYIRCNSEMEDL